MGFVNAGAVGAAALTGYLPKGRELDWSFAGYRGECRRVSMLVTFQLVGGRPVRGTRRQHSARRRPPPSARAACPPAACRWRCASAHAPVPPPAQREGLWGQGRRRDRRHRRPPGALLPRRCSAASPACPAYARKPFQPRQAAVAAANVDPGPILLPAGTYLLSRPLAILSSNVTLRGEGVSLRSL